MVSLKRMLRGRGKKLEADWLIVGLGNPGPDYASTRHNLGFKVVNLLAKRAGVKPVRIGSTMSAGSGTLAGERVALVKPLTMMNASGKAVAQALRATGVAIENTIVVYDDLDMAPGALRIRAGGGHGGHGGLKSIGGLAGLDFVRVKLGIGRPTGPDGKPTWDPGYVADYVLAEPSPAEQRILHDTVERAADAVEAIMTEGVDAAASTYNRKTG